VGGAAGVFEDVFLPLPVAVAFFVVGLVTPFFFFGAGLEGIDFFAGALLLAGIFLSNEEEKRCRE
jgi:hypothetical protein